MSITDFLNARIAEDEAAARAAMVSIHGETHENGYRYADYVLSSERDSTVAQDEFVIKFWPARVLAECAAKRAIVAEWEDTETGETWLLEGADAGYALAIDHAVRALAAVYADHQDYRDEWRVGV